MSAVNQRVLTGHMVRIFMRGQPIANCQGVSPNTDFGAQPVRGLGDLAPNEVVNTIYQGSLTISRFFMRRKNLAALGLTALSAEEILTMEPFSVQVIDKVSGRTIRVYEGCVPANTSENFTVSGMAGENMTLMFMNARGPGDETGSKLGNLGNAVQSVIGAVS